MRARFLRASLLCVLATLCARALAKNEPKETDQELLARTLASRPTFPTIATLKPMNAWSGRKNMVLASGGDSSVHDISWLDRYDSREFDLVMLYYGADHRNYTCARCSAVFASQGGKWAILNVFLSSPEWREVSRGYSRVMLADDDLLMSTHVLNRAFDIFESYELELGQISICRHPQSRTLIPVAWQEPDAILRYTAFVEIMAPIMTMETLTYVVAPTLMFASVGWGLDYVWPFLLNYPRDKVAVIDEVCMYHPKMQSEKQSIYRQRNPWGLNAGEEMRVTNTAFGFNQSAIASFKLPAWPSGVVFQKIKAQPRGLFASSVALGAGNPFSSRRLAALLPLCVFLGVGVPAAIYALLVASRALGREKLKSYPSSGGGGGAHADDRSVVAGLLQRAGAWRRTPSPTTA
ncbi:hypothetical protein H632_c702p0, partial [Helicosporidium sp. ATCC 50920]